MLYIIFKDKNDQAKTERNLKALFNILIDLGYTWKGNTELRIDDYQYNETLKERTNLTLNKNKRITKGVLTNINDHGYIGSGYALDFNIHSFKEIKEAILKETKELEKIMEQEEKQEEEFYI